MRETSWQDMSGQRTHRLQTSGGYALPCEGTKEPAQSGGNRLEEFRAGRAQRPEAGPVFSHPQKPRTDQSQNQKTQSPERTHAFWMRLCKAVLVKGNMTYLVPNDESAHGRYGFIAHMAADAPVVCGAHNLHDQQN